MTIVDLGGLQCRVIGISEGGSGNVLGNVFMDGLYVVHDRKTQRVGFSVASNCPNGLTSSKSISPVFGFDNDGSSSWCNCCSSNLRSDTLLNSYFPGINKCFFWFWWTYVVLVAIIIIFICLSYISYIYISSWIRRRRAAVVTPPDVVGFTEATTPPPAANTIIS